MAGNCKLSDEQKQTEIVSYVTSAKLLDATKDGDKGGTLEIQIDQQTVRGTVVRAGEAFHVFCQGHHTVLHYVDRLAHAGEAEAEGGRLTAPMPGKIVAVLVKAQQAVKKGDALLIMEAMKMEHTICAPHDGEVDELLYAIR